VLPETTIGKGTDNDQQRARRSPKGERWAADILTLTIVVDLWGSLSIVFSAHARVDKFWELSFLVFRLVMR
jgi:hypothetical protein